MWSKNKGKKTLTVFGKGHKIINNISLIGKSAPSATSEVLNNKKSKSIKYLFNNEQVIKAIDKTKFAASQYKKAMEVRYGYNAPKTNNTEELDNNIRIATDNLFSTMKESSEIIFNGDRSNWSKEDYAAMMYWGAKVSITDLLWYEKINSYIATSLLTYLKDGLNTVCAKGRFTDLSKVKLGIGIMDDDIPYYSPIVGFISFAESYYARTLGIVGLSTETLTENINWIMSKMPSSGKPGEKSINSSDLHEALTNAISNPGTSMGILAKLSQNKDKEIAELATRIHGERLKVIF